MQSFYNEILLRLGISLTETTLPNILFFYNSGVAVDGFNGLLDFDESSVIIKIGRDKVKICGKGLSICQITKDQIFVRGKISSIGEVNENQ